MTVSGSARHPLLALFRTSRDPVCGAKGGEIVFCNDAASALFGRDVTGESVRSLFPGLELSGGEEITAALPLPENAACVRAVPYEELWVLTVLREEKRSPLPPMALSRMRVAAANLRLAMDHLVDPQSEDPYAAVLYHSYYSLLHGVQQVSDVVALDREEMDCRLSPVELGRLALELTDSASFFLRDMEVTLRCQADEGPCMVMGDRGRLEQLVLILLSNSVRRVSRGGEIAVTVRPSGRQAFLTVEDNGPGMEDEDLRRAFTVRDDREELSGRNGAGMGLYIARGIARLHGGALLLRSREGEGTKISLSLPLADTLTLRDDAPELPRGSQRILTELSDLLDGKAYLPRNRD